MPKLSISLDTETYDLVMAEKEMASDESVSGTIRRLIHQGSKYEVIRTIEIKLKGG